MANVTPLFEFVLALVVAGCAPWSGLAYGRPAELICPCLIGLNDLMRMSYPAAVGDTTRIRVRQIFVVKKPKKQSGLMLDNSGRN